MPYPLPRARLAPSPFLLLLPLLLLPGAAHAAEAPAFGTPVLAAGFFSELRIGVLAHDPWSPERGTADLRAEVLFAKPFDLKSADHAGKWDFVIPRPHLGGTLNTGGKTSHFHAGLTWTFDLSEKLFIEAGLGGALHDGKTARAVAAGHNSLGCTAHFRETAGIGYRIDRNWNVMANIEHLSNAGLCRHNRGLTNIGVTLGYRF